MKKASKKMTVRLAWYLTQDHEVMYNIYQNTLESFNHDDTNDTGERILNMWLDMEQNTPEGILLNSTPDTGFAGLFRFQNTKEGFDYWDNINEECKEFCRTHAKSEFKEDVIKQHCLGGLDEFVNKKNQEDHDLRPDDEFGLVIGEKYIVAPGIKTGFIGCLYVDEEKKGYVFELNDELKDMGLIETPEMPNTFGTTSMPPVVLKLNNLI